MYHETKLLAVVQIFGVPFRVGNVRIKPGFFLYISQSDTSLTWKSFRLYHSHQGFATLSYCTVNQLLNQSNDPIHNYPISVHKATVRDEEHMKPYGLTLLDLDFLPCLSI